MVTSSAVNIAFAIGPPKHVKEVSPQYAGTKIESPATLSPPVDTAVMQGYIRRKPLQFVGVEQIFYFHAVDDSGMPWTLIPRCCGLNTLCHTVAAIGSGGMQRFNLANLFRRTELLSELGPDAGILEAQRQYYFVAKLAEPLEFIETTRQDTAKGRCSSPFKLERPVTYVRN